MAPLDSSRHSRGVVENEATRVWLVFSALRHHGMGDRSRCGGKEVLGLSRSEAGVREVIPRFIL